MVDDHRPTKPVSSLGSLPIHLVWHPHNAGYGANQKTCYLEALQRGADVVAMLHPDGQYEPELIPAMCAPILADEADLVLGSRFAEPGMAMAHGMPRWKYVVNRLSHQVENRIMGIPAERGSHRLPRLLSPLPCHRPVPAQRERLQLRLGDPDAGRSFRHANRRGSGQGPLPRGLVFGWARRRGRLRCEDRCMAA